MAEFWLARRIEMRRGWQIRGIGRAPIQHFLTLRALNLRVLVKRNSTVPAPAYDAGTVEKSDQGKEPMTDAVAALRKSLLGASEALTSGDAAEAEHRAKAISALVRAEREVAEFATAATGLDNDDEELCADLLRRLVRYTEADRQDAPPEVLERIATEGLVR
jgi:hypothetical protein